MPKKAAELSIERAGIRNEIKKMGSETVFTGKKTNYHRNQTNGINLVTVGFSKKLKLFCIEIIQNVV